MQDHEPGFNHLHSGRLLTEGRRSTEDGSAVVDFVLVSMLLTGLFLSLVQLCIVLYVRNVMVSAAAEGARYGANLNHSAADAQTRTETLVKTGLTGTIKPTVTALESNGLVQVDASAPIPLFGLFSFGNSITLHVQGHAVVEGR